MFTIRSFFQFAASQIATGDTSCPQPPLWRKLDSGSYFNNSLLFRSNIFYFLFRGSVKAEIIFPDGCRLCLENTHPARNLKCFRNSIHFEVLLSKFSPSQSSCASVGCAVQTAVVHEGHPAYRT